MTGKAFTRPRRRERVLVTRVGDEVALFDVDAGSYYGLNDVGGRVWELCDGTQTPDDLAAVIGDEYDVSLDVAAADVRELLSDLASENLIVEAK
jgi:formylglycine-generating enzyme required for sulfatase activity